MLALLLAAAAASSSFQPDLSLTATLRPEAHALEATAVVQVTDPRAGEPAFDLHEGLTVAAVLEDGAEVPFVREGRSLAVGLAKPRPGPHAYTVRYSGTIHRPPEVARFSRQEIADQTEGTIQPEGVFLSPGSHWYPRLRPGRAETSRVEIALPPGWDAVVEGSLVSRAEGEAGTRTVFESRHPLDGLDLAANRWVRTEQDHGGIAVAVYTFPQDVGLADTYIPAVKRSLDMLSARIGPYPFDRFTVVENFFPTGYGMPGFTLLGGDVMKLPFIPFTSLPHEVAHTWWGNGVRVDEKGGNWCEGLTTYVADYALRALEGPEAAAGYRREIVRDYTNYVSEPGRDLPLAAFTERSTPATRAVGYGKTMMVFHMLERRLGAERFDAVLRRVYRENLHKPASWDTWRGAFSREAGEDLGWYFDQWVVRTGAPELALQDVRHADGSIVGTIVQRQPGPAYELRVPVAIEGEGRTHRVEVEAGPFRIPVPFAPSVVRADPDQDLFRRLHPLEIPPVLSRVLGDAKAVIVVDDTGDPELASAYREMAAVLNRTGEGTVVNASQVQAAEIAGTVFLLGRPAGEAFAPVLAALPADFTVDGAAYDAPGAAILAVARHPSDPARAVALFRARTAAGARAAGRKLTHYGKYGTLAFVDGENRAKGIPRAEGGPMTVRLTP